MFWAAQIAVAAAAAHLPQVALLPAPAPAHQTVERAAQARLLAFLAVP